MNARQKDRKPRWFSFAQGVPLTALAIMYNQMLSFVVGILVARVLGAGDYGVTNIARTILELLAIISPLGFDLAMQRHLGAAPAARLGQLRAFRSVAFAIAVVPAALVACGVGAYVEHSIYRYSDFANILLVTLLALPFVTDMAVLNGAYRGILNPSPSILTMFVAQPTLRVIIMAALFACHWGLWAVVVGTSGSFFVSWTMLSLCARRDLAADGKLNASDWAEIRSVFGYSPSLGASLIFATSIRAADALILGYFASAREVGQYAAILMVTQFIGLLGFAVGQTLGPRIASCHRNNDIAGIEMLLTENIRLTSLLSAPVFAAVVVWGNRMDLVLGPTFATSGSVVSIIAARTLLQTIFGNSGFALSMTGWHLRETCILGGGLLVSVVLCFALIPSYGQMGAAWAGLISFAGVNLVRYGAVRSAFGIAHIRIATAKPILWAILVAAATHLLVRPFGSRTLSSTILESAIFFAVFVGSAWFLLVTNRDRETIWNLFARSSA
jgi:O-antigen/teichoic acid export membrane protein